MTSPLQTEDQASAVSFNYSLFKVLSILTVVASHWFAQIPLWIPTVVGLFIFAFSSALFTTRGYGPYFDIPAFWRKKLQRLLVRYWFLLVFLSALLLIEGRTVFHWHSLVHFFGLSALLNLFGNNKSGLGMGLWFFTVLLLFYVVYPYLARLCAANGKDFFLPLVASALFLYLDLHFIVGFSMWFTILGFFLGVFVGLHGTEVPWKLSFCLALGSMVAILISQTVFAYKSPTPWLLLLACISTNLWLLKARLPQWLPLRALARFESCLLEVFVIHFYFFVHPTGNSVLDFFVSLALILTLAWILNLIGSKIVEVVFKAKPRRTVLNAG